MALIEVTEVAAERIRDLLEKEEKLETHGLRMKVIGGGCSGLRYELAFDDEITDRDNEIVRSGVRVIIDEKSGGVVPYLPLSELQKRLPPTSAPAPAPQTGGQQ